MKTHVLIIAEAGVNHNGDLATAKLLIDKAAEAGVDLVKFQTFKADKIVSPAAKKAAYQIENTSDSDSSQYQMLKALELSEANHYELIEYCKEKGVEFFSTGFDNDSLDFLNGLGLPQHKIPSGEITNYPYLKKVASFGKPTILSTGMSSLDEIKNAVDVLVSSGLDRTQITVLHCNTEYPTPMQDVNLTAMLTIKEALGVEVGYSDHTLGTEVPIAAVALGAVVIEKHFTLDRKLPGPDHRASLEPDELNQMVKSIRSIEKAISGNGVKEPSSSETKNIGIARKSIHTSRPLKKDDKITESHLLSLRPGDGISPMKWNDVLGKRAGKDLDTGHKLSWEDLV